MLYLLTGCAGFIGSCTTEQLLTAGHTVYGLDNRNDAYDPVLKEWRLQQLARHARFHFCPLDITDRSALSAWVFSALQNEGKTSTDGNSKEISEKNGFDACIHLAARAGVRYSVENPWIYLDTNVTGTLNILELCRETNTKKLVMASSSSVYGNTQEEIFRENQPTDTPCSPYAASKKAGEALAYSYHHLYGLDVSALRFFTVYGPAGRPDMSILRFVHAIAEGIPLRLYGNGEQERDFTYCDDIAAGVISALRPVGYEIFNLGGDHTYSIRELIEIIARQLEKSPIIECFPAHPADVDRTCADISKARQFLDWEPCWTLENGIAQTISWYLANRDWVRELRTLRAE
ncbi:MAG: GDP-mannose 4,6-dehydratase [Planctomycetia bacterium]|nr:GDP-mannose 4,6-dehydratase [Planctomycetia bacterium]